MIIDKVRIFDGSERTLCLLLVLLLKYIEDKYKQC